MLGNAEPIFPRLDLEALEPKVDPMAINPDLVIENAIDISEFDKLKIQVLIQSQKNELVRKYYL